jgi:adenosine deaminase
LHINQDKLIEVLRDELIHIISETNGISLYDTLELLSYSQSTNNKIDILIKEFQSLIAAFHRKEANMESLLNHPVSEAFFQFFKNFPLPYHEEHIHLTGSLSADFIFPRIKKLLKGKDKVIYEKKIIEVYGKKALPINSREDVDNLIRLKDGEMFITYLKILYLAKLILVDKKAHEEAAYHMAHDLYHKYNVGHIRLKFTLSRASKNSEDKIPGTENLSEEDVLIALYKGFKKFQAEVPIFDFVLSPCFRKEEHFFDNEKFDSKEDHFIYQVNSIIKFREKHPEIGEYLTEVDTVGDEKELYRKKHFYQMKNGLRRLQYNGFKIRSHHGETWKNLRTGVQSVDNAMNIWHINTLEHGLSLGINPNFYFHRLFQRVMEKNKASQPINKRSSEFLEINDMEWHDSIVKEKIIKGEPLSEEEEKTFLKTKFHTAREIEHYQHDVLNRMINKKVSLVALPSSNLKLTGCFPDYKDHPFSWWEKKGVKLGIGTDNYITLDTNFIQELLILLYSDPSNLKITRLLMIATKEDRRPFISHLLWELRKQSN